MPSRDAAAPPRICVVYTGGTMGSKPGEDGLLSPAPLDEFKERVADLRSHTWRASLSYAQITAPLIDSASATPADWFRVRDVLEREWPNYDGFVVVHGTDTMPYIAAFLSFAIV